MNHHRHTHSPTVIRTKPGSPTVYPSRWDFTVLKGSTITDLVSSYCFLQESLAPKNVMFIYCLFICLLDFTYIYIYKYVYIYMYNIYIYYICLKFVSTKICEPIRLPWKRHCRCQRPWRGAQFHPRLHEPLLRSLQFPADSHPGALLSSGHPGNPRWNPRCHGTGLENMKDLGVIR